MRTAVPVQCYNEATTVAKIVGDLNHSKQFYALALTAFKELDDMRTER